jgi:hypothetical protein
VRFDDRLLTVLNQPAGDRHDTAVRWRQLVDLVARAGSNASSPTVAEALQSIRNEGSDVDEQLRAATARAVAALPLPLGLLEYFASDRLAVSAPVLAAATLDVGQWQVLLRSADEETRRFIETLHPELKSEALLDPSDKYLEPAETAVAVASPAAPSLHDVVARIERRRRNRAAPGVAADHKPLPEGSPALFRWECGPGGEIAWVEGAPRGPLIGRSIARPNDGKGDRIDEEVVRAFTMRAPFRDASLTVAGSGRVSGEWKISGVPAFEPRDGRFAGYRGIALRENLPAPVRQRAADLLGDPDSVRELVHEIKTPLNAIIGFAEIIVGQYLGPADRRYRERASDIVGQARLLLTAIDDLDFAAKIHSAGKGQQPPVNMGELVGRLTPALREIALENDVELESSRTVHLSARVDPELAERVIFRICRALIERAEPRERLRLSVDQANGQCSVSISRPAALQGMTDDQLFGGDVQNTAFAGCFWLRLARGLARIAGADLVGTPSAIALVMPRA